MNCEFCDGTGNDDPGEPCIHCNGAGKLCDECGKPIGEEGHIHRRCLSILRADRRRDEAKDES